MLSQSQYRVFIFFGKYFWYYLSHWIYSSVLHSKWCAVGSVESWEARGPSDSVKNLTGRWWSFGFHCIGIVFLLLLTESFHGASSNSSFHRRLIQVFSVLLSHRSWKFQIYLHARVLEIVLKMSVRFMHRKPAKIYQFPVCQYGRFSAGSIFSITVLLLLHSSCLVYFTTFIVIFKNVIMLMCKKDVIMYIRYGHIRIEILFRLPKFFPWKRIIGSLYRLWCSKEYFICSLHLSG